MVLTLSSPAKVNLFLKVVGQRPDGFHELASLMQTVDLCDTLHFTLDKEDSLTCDDPTIPTDGTNLILKAAALFRRKVQKHFGVRVHLEKLIPSQSGLGGGSSNAATTLWALNTLLDWPATLDELKEWSAEIGSDVPFFFSKGTAYCTGRGEKVKMIDPLPAKNLWIVKPEQGLPTPAIYNRMRIEELEERDHEAALESILQGESRYFNDLEEPAFAIYPKLAAIKEKMIDAGFKTVTMTGSGSALFCTGDSKPPQTPDIRSYATAFLNRSDNEWFKPCCGG
ncbi:MAG: 4-diphosphocytidyl-2-C-methyl-D-erythritol kinase [Chlamydiae bacterium]|nr:4-diphosphocytidyl-2-C-methyl-D-erythritol kinase [Chlamydiota bacterium]